MRLAYSQYPSWQPDVGLQEQALALLAQKVDQFLRTHDVSTRGGRAVRSKRLPPRRRSALQPLAR